MPPSSVTALLILVVAVLPGATYTWAFERQAGPYGVSLADRTFRFVAASVICHLILGWPEYWLYRVAFHSHNLAAGQFAAAWAAVLLLTVLPAIVGAIQGRLYASRNRSDDLKLIRRAFKGPKRKKLLASLIGHERAPRAWDNLFSGRPDTYLRVRTSDGSWLAGLFASKSYAAGYPNDTDLYLEEAWGLEEDSLELSKPLGYPLYIPASTIAWIEVIVPQID
jgi:hypothetical protein